MSILFTKSVVSLSLAANVAYANFYSHFRKTPYIFFNKNKVIMEIINTPLLPSQYYTKQTKKTAIVLHHSVSGDSAKNVVAAWNESPQKVGAHFIITRAGVIHEAVPPECWIHHLGVKNSVNTLLNKQSIAIELLNYGPVEPTTKAGIYRNAYAKEITIKREVYYKGGFRGYTTFEAYTPLQLAALDELLRYLMNKFNIKLQPDFSAKSIFDVCEDALRGSNGIFTHVSFRDDKSDCHPQPELIGLLDNLKF